MEPQRRYWSEVQVGEALPTLDKPPLSRVQVARYAGAAGEWDPVHLDEPYALDMGLPSVMAQEMLVMGFLGELVSAWQGPTGRTRRLGVRFVKMVWPGDVVTCRGRVLELRHADGKYCVELDLWAENQHGDLVAKGSAMVQLFHSPDDEIRQARGEGPLVLQTPPPPPLQERIGTPMAPITAVPRTKPAAKKPAAKKPAAKKPAVKKPAAKKPAAKKPAAKKPAAKKPAAKKKGRKSGGGR